MGWRREWSSGSGHLELGEGGHERVIVCVGSQLRRVVDDSEEVVDWHATLFLNIICHTTYSLTVAVCRYGCMGVWGPSGDMQAKVCI